MTTITSTDLRNKSIGLYTPPFRFEHGYIWDAKGQMVADNHVDGEDGVLRVRGWGRISYMENPEALQDEVGNVIALAMTEFWERRKAEKDSEPVAWLAIYHGEVYDEAIGITRSVVEAQADHFGWESALTEIIPLYSHAQQPVVPEEMNFSAACNFVQINGMAKEDRVTLAMRVWNACRAAILQAQSDDDGEPTDDERIMAIEGIHNCERCGDEGWVMGEMGITRCACGQAGNSPVIPEGYVMVPKEPTKEMIDAGWLHYMGTKNPSSKGTYKAMLAAAPQEVKGE